jgi:hypothetical protein
LGENKKKIEDIKIEINLLKKDMDNIQSICPHEEHMVKFDSENHAIQKICKKCEKVIGYPTNDELKEKGFI